MSSCPTPSAATVHRAVPDDAEALTAPQWLPVPHGDVDQWRQRGVLSRMVANVMRSTVAWLVLSTAALLAQAASHEPSIGIVFPDELAGLQLVDRREFPQKELGVNLAYEDGALRGSIFIYTAGATSILEGAENEKVRKHFEQVIGEVRQLQAMGKLRGLSFREARPQLTGPVGCGPRFLWQSYDMTVPDDIHLESYTFLTAVRNHFVKLRISYRKGAPRGKRDVERFAAQVSRLVGECA